MRAKQGKKARLIGAFGDVDARRGDFPHPDRLGDPLRQAEVPCVGRFRREASRFSKIVTIARRFGREMQGRG